MLNEVLLIGRLIADPVLKNTPTDVPVCSFRIAVNRKYTTKGGERPADYIDIVAWRQTAEFVAKYFSKGQRILIIGSIQTRNYTDKNDNKRTAVEVIADSADFVDSKASAGGDGGNAPAPARGAAAPATPVAAAAIGDEDFFEIGDEGDLPF